MAFVVLAARLHHQAACSCGWLGRSRWLRGLAVVDAHVHGAQTGHMPADPVIVHLDAASVRLLF